MVDDVVLVGDVLVGDGDVLVGDGDFADEVLVDGVLVVDNGDVVIGDCLVDGDFLTVDDGDIATGDCLVDDVLIVAVPTSLFFLVELSSDICGITNFLFDFLHRPCNSFFRYSINFLYSDGCFRICANKPLGMYAHTSPP